MKVGDYIRTDDGYIFRAKQLEDVEGEEINEDEFQAVLYYYDEVHLIDIDKIKKFSPNIIDLIGVGDYVNGYKVISLWKDKTKVIGVAVDGSVIGFDEDEIKSIVTKEQFESMEYKVGE